MEEQAESLSEAARKLPDLTPEKREELRSRVLDLLRHDVVEHMRTDERLLYPKVVERLGDPLAAAPMNYEHRAIRWWIDQIARADIRDQTSSNGSCTASTR